MMNYQIMQMLAELLFEALKELEVSFLQWPSYLGIEMA